MSLMPAVRSFHSRLQPLLFAGSCVLELACANDPAPSGGGHATTDNAET